MGILNDICKAENIKLKAFSRELAERLYNNPNDAGKGLSIAAEGEKYIIFDSSAPIWEQRFTVSHEMAHHLLGHLRPDTTLMHQDKEMEADIFAAVFTALLLFQEYQITK